MKKLFLACLGLTLAAHTSTSAPAEGSKPALGAWGVDLTSLDPSVKPGENFFMYVNGTWLAKARIPADRTRTGSFPDLQILSETRMTDIVSGLRAKPYQALNGDERKLRDLYEAYVDTDRIEKQGLGPATKDLETFASLRTWEGVARAMASPVILSDSLFSATIGADAKNSNAYVMTLGQSGLGLPDRDYYLRADPDLASTRDAYRKYLTSMLALAGVDDSGQRAAAVFTLETEIAKASWAVADRRDASRIYNPMTVVQLEQFAPGFPWTAFLEARGLPLKGPSGDRVVIVRERTAFPALARIFAATPVRVWGDWLTVHFLHSVASDLPKRFEDADFAFYGQVLDGQRTELPRDTRGVQLLDQRLGDALGQLYVAKYFPQESRAKVEALIVNLLKAYDADIRQLPWMTGTTRQKALDKLHAFVPHVGYPDRWRDLSGLMIARDDLLGDLRRSKAFEARYRLDRIDRPVDRSEWTMTPPTVNAYYTPVFNSIFFPAAILQPPFFDPNADDAVNYGAIGAVIGHEISHGFDDQGSKYDGAGNLRSWWTDADRNAFEERVTRLGGQYDAYEGLPGLHLNGKLTMGENIGDLSGLTIALKAYQLSLDGRTPPVMDGYTGVQRFFLAFGQVWRSKYREPAMRQQILSNPHSPPEFRVIGPTRNIDEWYDAFRVKPGDREYLPPDQRVHLW
jgi:putative endopeptidase